MVYNYNSILVASSFNAYCDTYDYYVCFVVYVHVTMYVQMQSHYKKKVQDLKDSNDILKARDDESNAEKESLQ